ncbi:UDP-N-acetylglucosamine 2-epimerase [Methylomonas sp. AM2-LC]|uniref:UDP-N-acetylglucosamine 2-epimerase n=1 Tax=Methylomonas sp. AM2-LC TaxID=3153301 RepID=UPI0032642D64
MARKICVVTGSRAEYGLLHWLLKAIQADTELQLQLLVTGMHLSSEFGLTWQQIVADGFEIDHKVEMLLSSDSVVGICKSMGVGLIGVADALQDLQPDILVVLGDRFEILVAAQAAMIQRIPIAHIHGGELTEGAVDDSIRHAISKMSHLHFTSTEGYKRRVIQLGEQPHRVFNVGAPGLDNIYRQPLLNRLELENALGFSFAKHNLLVTFHPVTLENNSSVEQFTQLLQALDSFQDVHIIFTHANADADGRSMSVMIENYQKANPLRVASFVSLGSLKYLSVLKQVNAVVGNSSSGLLEAPACGVATVNIGDRQRGRIAGASVIHCLPIAEEIRAAIHTALSDEFLKRLNCVENPYGQGGASEKIKDILKQVSLQDILKKHFYDVSTT